VPELIPPGHPLTAPGPNPCRGRLEPAGADPERFLSDGFAPQGTHWPPISRSRRKLGSSWSLPGQLLGSGGLHRCRRPRSPAATAFYEETVGHGGTYLSWPAWHLGSGPATSRDYPAAPGRARPADRCSSSAAASGSHALAAASSLSGAGSGSVESQPPPTRAFCPTCPSLWAQANELRVCRDLGDQPCPAAVRHSDCLGRAGAPTDPRPSSTNSPPG